MAFAVLTGIGLGYIVGVERGISLINTPFTPSQGPVTLLRSMIRKEKHRVKHNDDFKQWKKEQHQPPADPGT